MVKIELNIQSENTIKTDKPGFVNLAIFQPHAPNPDATKLIDAIGLEAYQALVTIECIKKEIEEADSRQPYIIFQLIKGLISVFITENPNHMHFVIVKAAIEEIDPEWHNDTFIRDMAARELIMHCRKLNAKLIAPPSIKKALDCVKSACDDEAVKNGYSKNPALEVYSLPIDQDFHESSFECNEMFLWDKVFLDVIKLTGKEGRNSAKEGTIVCKDRLKNFKIGTRNPLTFWLDPEAHHLSHALKILTKAIIKDKIKKHIQFKKENVPAITTKIQDPLKRLLSPQNEVVEKDTNIQIFNQESLVGSILIPAIPQKIISSVFNGIHKLNTVTGHRITRFLILTAYDQKTNGQCDFRVLKLDRGATELAERLGLNSNKAITNIKEIVHAMAYFEFQGPHLTGNLIQLSKYKSSKTYRQESYEITVGTPLVPYQTFKDGGLLIPLLQDPPLVNPNQSHAGQYLLQMEVMEEFSNQSVQLATEGVVQISKDQWRKFAESCQISPEVLTRIQDRWTQDGTDGAQFLKPIEDDFYTLGQEHHKALEFLKIQGEKRIKNSNRGAISASKKRKK